MTLARRPPPELFKLAVNRWTEPFWEGCRQKRLLLARCADCGHARMPPTPFCPRCQSQRVDWSELSGQGTVYSYTVVARAILPGMEAHLPYVPAVVSLEGAEGARLISNIVDVEIEALYVGMPVRLVWDAAPEQGVAIARFAPAA